MKLSIITINYNNLDGLKKTVDSILTQTWSDYEWIIIDGGSTDGSKELIEKTAAQCPNISYWCSEVDEGVYNAMNKGITHANGEYLNFMNSGDRFTNVNVLASLFHELDGTDIICGNTYIRDGFLLKSPSDISIQYFYRRNTLCHQSCFIKTELQKQFLYDETLKIVSDRKFFLQCLISRNVSYKGINVAVADYDMKGISSDYQKTNEETSMILSQLFSKHMLSLIHDYSIGNTLEDKFFVKLKTSRFRRFAYSLLVVILKIVRLFTGKIKWIDVFPYVVKGHMDR